MRPGREQVDSLVCANKAKTGLRKRCLAIRQGLESALSAGLSRQARTPICIVCTKPSYVCEIGHRLRESSPGTDFGACPIKAPKAWARRMYHRYLTCQAAGRHGKEVPLAVFQQAGVG
jgi:hypothetical protein